MTNLLTYIIILLFSFTSSVNACYSPISPNAYTDDLWINGKDTGLGNWSVDNKLSYVIGNTVDWSKVENRDNLDPITIGLGVVAGVSLAKSIADNVKKGNEVWEKMPEEMKAKYTNKYTFLARNIMSFNLTALENESELLKDATPIARREVLGYTPINEVDVNMTPIVYKVGENNYYNYDGLNRAIDDNKSDQVGSYVDLILTYSPGVIVVGGKLFNSFKYQKLYRAVEPNEYLDLMSTGKFNPSPFGSESKYFSTTYKGALKEGNEVLPKISTYSADDYKYVKTYFPKSELKNIPLIYVDGGVPTYNIPNNLLNKLTEPKILK